MKKCYSVLCLIAILLPIIGCDGYFLDTPPPEPFPGAEKAAYGDPIVERHIWDMPLAEQHKFFRYCVQTVRPALPTCQEIFARSGIKIMLLVQEALLVEKNDSMKYRYLLLVEELVQKHSYCPTQDGYNLLITVVNSIEGAYNQPADSVIWMIDKKCNNLYIIQ